MKARRLLILIMFFVGLSAASPSASGAGAQGLSFRSPLLDADLPGTLHVPDGDPVPGGRPLVIVLQNLATPRAGRESDDAIRRDLLGDGVAVWTIDYRHDPRATTGDLSADVLALRAAVAGPKPTHLLDAGIDRNRVFVLPSGHRLRQHVEFARDGERVLAMDVAYPSNPAAPVPAVIEFSCDNVNRMGSGSLLFCRDTLLETFALAGFAVAMADHPVAPPYKGVDDPMPRSLHHAKAAVRTLRGLAGEVPIDGRVGVAGFSRGAVFSAMLASTNGRDDLDGVEDSSPASSDVQAALVHGNRFDYLAIPLDDPMYARLAKAWGPRDANPDRWAEHGAVHYLTPGARVAPMYLNASDAESPEYRAGLARLAERLRALGVPHVHRVDADGRGHRVTTDPATLREIVAFFRTHLDATPPPTRPSDTTR
jgi:hypothetical protein